MNIETTLLHIVHPHTYKAKGKNLVVGPIKEFEQRDKEISKFLKQAAESGLRLLFHFNEPTSTPQFYFQMAGLYQDPLFKDYIPLPYLDFPIDLDKIREKFTIVDSTPKSEYIVTPNTGLPIPDIRPEKIPEDIWEIFKASYASNLDIDEKIGEEDTHLVIGGLFEACVRNVAVLCQTRYKPPNGTYVIRDLCVTECPGAAHQSVSKHLEKVGINVVDSVKIANELFK